MVNANWWKKMFISVWFVGFCSVWFVGFCSGLVRFMVFDATFNNISVILWWSILLVEETGVAGENHRPAVSHWQTLSHNVVSPEWDLN